MSQISRNLENRILTQGKNGIKLRPEKAAQQGQFSLTPTLKYRPPTSGAMAQQSLAGSRPQGTNNARSKMEANEFVKSNEFKI